MLRSITLTNWRSHAKSLISLSAGANLLVGPMGAGKSSCMDGLCFALYGTYPKLGRRDAKLEEVSNFRHSGQSVSVEVEWDDSLGGAKPAHTYKVRREPGSSGAWLYVDGKLVQKSPRAVTEEIERILQIPYELFSRAVYAEQNRMDAWLSLPPANRKSELDRLLGLDHFERARASAGAEINRLKERAQDAEAAAPLSKLQQEQAILADKGVQLLKRKAERAGVEEELKAAKEQAVSLSSQWDVLEKTKKAREELSARANKLTGSISTWQKTISSSFSLPSIEELEPKIAALKTDRVKLEEELKNAHASSAELGKTSGKIGEQLKNEQTRALRSKQLIEKHAQLLAGKSPEALRTELANLQTSLQARLAQSAALEKERQNISQVLKTIGISAHGEKSAQCPVCRQSLDESHRSELERAHKASLIELEAKIAKNNELNSADRKSIERLSSLDAEASRLQAQMAALGEAADAGTLQTQLDSNRQAAAALASRMADAQARLTKRVEEENKLSSLKEQAKQLAHWRSQLASAQKEQAQLAQQLLSMQFDESAYLVLKQKREELLGITARLSESLRSLSRMLEQDEQLLQTQQKLLEQLQLKRAEAETARKEMDELSSFRNVLAATQSSLRSRLLSDINSALARIWPLVYPYGDWSRVRLSASEKDYAVEIHQGEWKALEAHASGGERACLGLALRVALSVLLTPSLGWLILDEPTHNLDSRAVQGLGVALSEAIPQIVPQVIVITHENQLVESTPGRVIRFSRDKLKGEDTKVEVEGQAN